MATPGQLMEAVQRATGVPLPTIVDLDRKLVKGGLRTTGGRGLNAAKMTPLDAARLLTALLASPQANTAVEAVNRYARTRADQTHPGRHQGTAAWLADFASLPAGHSFIEAIASLLATVPIGAAARAPRLQIEICALTQQTRGRIHISGPAKAFAIDVRYGPRPVATKSRTSKRPEKEGASAYGDLEQSRRITERTIYAVADCLHV